MRLMLPLPPVDRDYWYLGDSSRVVSDQSA
jgi:hypothetical protein